MQKFKEQLKKNSLLTAIVYGLRNARSIAIRTVNSFVLAPLSISSKYIGSPKKELGGIEDTIEYFEKKKQKGARVNFWHLLEGKIEIKAPKYTIGVPQADSEIYTRTAKTDEYFFSMPNGRVYFDDYCVITEDDYLVCQVSNVYSLKPKSHPVFERLKLPKTEKLKGKTILLRGGAGYYHAVIDALPGLYLAEMCGYKTEEIDYFAVLNLSDQVYNDLFARIGIPRSKIIDLKTKGQAYECEELLFSTFYDRQGDWYKDYLIKKLNIQPVRKEFPKRIYISREKAKMRRVLNQDEVVAFLKPYGFEKVLNEDLSIDEQVALNENATHIISTHGANLVNLIFCKPGAQLCEVRYVKHSNYHRKTYFEMAQSFGVDYYLLYCNEGTMVMDHAGLRNDSESDMVINLNELGKMLHAMGLEPVNA